MRGDRHIVAGEPCLTPIKMSSEKLGLLQDARDGNLNHMKKRMRNSIFRKPEDVNQRDERFCTPLHYAAKNGHLDMIQFLVDKGGDIKSTDKHGWSILQYAVRYASIETVEKLIEIGCDLSHTEKKGWNCLHLAARNGQPEKARLLLEFGVDVNAVQDQGWNALHLAVRYGQPDTISTLLEYGIDINANNLGWTALHLAALNGHTDIASILLNKGANISTVNLDGKTALDIARDEKHDRIVAIILELEFQTELPEEVLPSPPPTPPSAPPMELMCQVGGQDQETFQEWSWKIQNELDRVDQGLNSDEENDGQDKNNKNDTLDIRITWKSFEEEAKELMNQLESLRLQEVNKVKKNITRCKRDFNQKLLRYEKQRHVLEAQIENIQSKILPELENTLIKCKAEHENAISEIDVLLSNSLKESDIIESLKNQQMENKYSECASQKLTTLENLEKVQRLETQQLKENRFDIIASIQALDHQYHSDLEINAEKIRVLNENLNHVTKSKSESKKSHDDKLQELNSQLEKAERRSHLQANINNGPEQDEHWFGCPVCLVLLRPPMRIFQCPEGHILCEECKENPAMVHCPQCRCPLEGQCSRNRALEEVARSYYPLAPSETL